MWKFQKEAVKKFSIWDIKSIKWSAFFFGLFIATFIPVAFLVNWRWLWLIIAIIAAIKPLVTAFRK